MKLSVGIYKIELTSEEADMLIRSIRGAYLVDEQDELCDSDRKFRDEFIKKLEGFKNARQ